MAQTTVLPRVEFDGGTPKFVVDSTKRYQVMESIGEGGVAKDPTERYPSVEAMIERLDKRAEGDIPVQCPMTLVKTITHRFTRLLDHHPLFVLFAVCVVLLTAVAGIVFSIWKLS